MWRLQKIKCFRVNCSQLIALHPKSKKRIKKNAPLNDAFLILHYRFKNYLAFVSDVAAAQITTPKAILLTKSAKLYTIFRVPASALPVYPR